MKKSKRDQGLKILFKYLKEDKIKVILYIFLTVLIYLPQAFSALLIGKGLEVLLLKQFDKFVLYLAIYEGIFIFFYCFLQYPQTYLYNYLEVKFNRNISKEIYSKYQDLPAIAFEETGVGELINRLTSDPERVLELLSRLIRLFCKFVVFIFALIICFKVSIWIGLEILIFSIIMGTISYKFFPVIKETHKKIKTETDSYVKYTTENITGIREIKSLGIKQNMSKRVNLKIDQLADQTTKIRRYENIYYNLNGLIYFILQFIILLTCGYLFIKGYIAYAIFMMIENYLWRIDEVVENLSDFGVNYNKVKVSLNRIDEVINNRIYEDEKFGNVSLRKINGKIEFKNVYFKYRDDEDLTLKGLNLEFEPYKKNAVVGRSGNGKTTLFNLLLRYFDSTKGKILIDGYDIKDLSEETLRKHISIIRQNPFIFNMSIMENFRIVNPKITLKEVRELCKKAYIDDYIMSLPKKYNTIIGEGGINLSGGQKQRLAIARTLLLNTKIILFDEATSALDNESQEYIKKTIDNLVKDHTVIIVAHRLSTIVDADDIYLIDKGKLVAQGSHKELIKNCKSYQKLYNSEDRNLE